MESFSSETMRPEGSGTTLFKYSKKRTANQECYRQQKSSFRNKEEIKTSLHDWKLENQMPADPPKKSKFRQLLKWKQEQWNISNYSDPLNCAGPLIMWIFFSIVNTTVHDLRLAESRFTESKDAEPWIRRNPQIRRVDYKLYTDYPLCRGSARCPNPCRVQRSTV